MTTMLGGKTSEPSPPGQTRPWPQPSKTGKASFPVAGIDQVAETAYKIWGSLDSGKIPLIVLHGGPGIPPQYLQTISLVFTGYGNPVVLYDQLGCGDSTHLPERLHDDTFWTPQLFMNELDNLKNALGIKDFHLFGHSWGGMLAVEYAIGQPRGLQKLILANSITSMDRWIKVITDLRSKLPEDVQETLQKGEEEGRTDPPEYEAAVMAFYKRHLCRIDPFPEELMASMGALEGDNTVYVSMYGTSEVAVTGSLKNWTIEKSLHKITSDTVPGGILLLNGYYDEAQDEAMEAFFRLPTARVKWMQFAQSSHMPQLEETEKYIKVLGSFLTQE